MTIRLEARGLAKTFILHTQGGTRIPVLRRVDFFVRSGECVCIHGASGAGKSTLLRCLYGNYKPDGGQILVEHEGDVVDLVAAEPWDVLEIRRRTIGYVSQFLRVIPRVATLDLVAEPAILVGRPPHDAYASARTLLTRLRIPERLWGLAPATFSGGEQQRINIARVFNVDYPILLLDEPTASLDLRNRSTVVELIREARSRGTAIVGIFHDEDIRQAVADRLFHLEAAGGTGNDNGRPADALSGRKEAAA
jgi:alpha-D-ribose 1-methylphosphonate 5-triphosphate synthase subunit PhnL